jgi:UDP-glucose 4-epimerase
MKILVTGGAGYIGSHTVLALLNGGHEPVVLDNLSTGTKKALIEGVEFVEGDISDQKIVRDIIKRHDIDAVMHFAALISVPESVENPILYYKNNVSDSIELLEASIDAGVNKFIFSSSAAVYGTPIRSPVVEGAKLSPESPYGQTKVMLEEILHDLLSVYQDFRYIALRYFNVAGADQKGRIGNWNPDPQHLIARACRAALLGEQLEVFGTDYPTEDGTCVRDYIHVVDIADAHVRALEYLEKGGASQPINCGYGKGHSVLEVVKTVEQVSKKKLDTLLSPRRSGDVASVVANSSNCKDSLGWKPQFDDLDVIIRDEIKWQRKLRKMSR